MITAEEARKLISQNVRARETWLNQNVEPKIKADCNLARPQHLVQVDLPFQEWGPAISEELQALGYKTKVNAQTIHINY